MCLDKADLNKSVPVCVTALFECNMPTFVQSRTVLRSTLTPAWSHAAAGMRHGVFLYKISNTINHLLGTRDHYAGPPSLIMHYQRASVRGRWSRGISATFLHRAVPDPSHPFELHRDEQATKATVSNNAESH